MQAAVVVVNRIALLVVTLSPYTFNAANTDIRYRTTPSTVATASATYKNRFDTSYTFFV